jgi:hypothetical protein
MREMEELLYAVLAGLSIFINLLCDTFDAVIIMMLCWSALLGVFALCLED